jgi:hypothetical protein
MESYDTDYEEEFEYNVIEPYHDHSVDSDEYDELDHFDDNDYMPKRPSNRPLGFFNIASNSPTKNSPTKNSPTKNSPTKSWWDRKNTICSDRVVGGVLNYSALLPPPEKRVVSSCPDHLPPPDSSPTDGKKQPVKFCAFVLKGKKCGYGEKCRFAHSYSQLKECFFNTRCKKIKIVKSNPDGTIEMINKGEGCFFKHLNESKKSYMERVGKASYSTKKN